METSKSGRNAPAEPAPGAMALARARLARAAEVARDAIDLDSSGLRAQLDATARTLADAVAGEEATAVPRAVVQLRAALDSCQRGDPPVPELVTNEVARALEALFRLARLVEKGAAETPVPLARRRARPAETPIQRPERRATRRVEIVTEVGFDTETNFFAAYSEDLSDGASSLRRTSSLPSEPRSS